MLKETKDLSGIKLFWAVKTSARQANTEPSTVDNTWIIVETGTAETGNRILLLISLILHIYYTFTIYYTIVPVLAHLCILLEQRAKKEFFFRLAN